MHLISSRFLLASLIVAVLAALPFLSGLPGDFVFDDTPNIVNNTSIQLKQLDVASLLQVIETPQISGSMRTLPTLTFALDYWRAGGADPATFKATNIFIQAVTALALAWLLRSLLLLAGLPDRRVRWLAPALALAWAVHPLQVSSVLYAVQRLQTLGTLFLVLALLAYLQARRAQIEGRSGRTSLMSALLLWVVAMSCKEDSAQLPAYTLALELTVLRFRAADPRLARTLQRGYALACLLGVALYLFVVIPHAWHWDAYAGRDFSTPERLLTQARVLCLYMGQIVWPLPQHMPFYYDWLQPSRGLLQPWTTLPAILLIAGLLALAWRLRSRQPLLALGILWFFSAHFITSNVIGLELAFEHRNHFALIGAVLAVGSLLARVSLRGSMRPAAQAAVCVAVLALLGGTTVLRAQSWSSNLSLALSSTKHAPHSARAWVELCATYFQQGGGAVPGNTQLNEAIAACENGATLAPYALNNVALLIVLKTLRGDVSAQDWSLLQQRLETVNMSWDNRRAPLILTYRVTQGMKLDKQPLLKVLATLEARATHSPRQLASLGYFLTDYLAEPDLAMSYFAKAVAATPAYDQSPQQLADKLRVKGRADLAEKIEQLAQARHSVTGAEGQ